MRSAAAEEIARVDDDAHIEWLRRIDEARERYDAFASRVVADFDHAVETHAPREVARLDDPTLRRGDIVVTATGPMMFKGSSKSVYDLSDFEPVGEAHARRSEHRAALLDILRAPALGGR
ncbi:hypothetical protein IY145_19035 [Methylosinus sp. H3A]|uniref:hypothetical protein n=1 Tax=Methylosinus sp. H3A TaxID=2785786 RepID=UPI0018C220B6|nr:hypothetical protein [Methylosinus sp. H3A]MBG0811450.1 hypothetical protein [Methylosinus sp. H3A]